MTGVWDRMKTDMDVKRQVLAVSLIAFLMGTFELIFFLRIVVPTVRSGMVKMLRDLVPSGPPNLARRVARTAVAVAEERERDLVVRNNASARTSGIIIALVPLLLVLWMLSRYPDLRCSGRRHVILDVLMVFGCLVAFQVTFFFLGQQFAYTSSPEMVNDIAKQYNHTFDDAAERATPPPPLTPEEKLALTRTAISMAQTHLMPHLEDWKEPVTSFVEKLDVAPSSSVPSSSSFTSPPAYAWTALAQAAANGLIRSPPSS